MKKLLQLLSLTLALNFLAAAGFVGWLVKAGRLDKARRRHPGDRLPQAHPAGLPPPSDEKPPPRSSRSSSSTTCWPATPASGPASRWR